MKKDLCSAGSRQRVAKPGEVYAFYVEMLGKYGACQVLAVDDKSICYVLLDYLESVIPKEEILERLKTYHRESFRYHHQIVKTGIENTPVPRDYQYIGQCGLKSDPVWDFYSWKWSTGEEYYYEERWKGKLDRLCVTHLRDGGWLKDNLENPLRHWDGNEFIPEAAYRSARKCYKDTGKQLLETADRQTRRRRR